MFDFTCQMPGVDAATVAWHTAIHLALAGFVSVSGSAFLGRAVVVYRRMRRPPAGTSLARPSRRR